MTQFEYHVSNGNGPVTDGHLNVQGAEGWELVTIISRPGLPERAYFKRPIVAKKAPAKKGTR